MCGIIGSVNSHNKLINVSGIESIAHRGPNNSGNFFSRKKHVWLGHTRLAIISPGEDANQPFHSSDDRYILVYNGEIYNYVELANKHALSLRTGSDTELVVELYAKLGPSFLNELNGMFAGVIYDTATEEIFLFRDRMGIKPLYYYRRDEKFAFASELPALINEVGNISVINDQAVADFLHFGYIPEPRTLYKDIFKFPSGSFAIYKNSKLDITTFWNAEDHISASVISNEVRVLDKVEDLLRDSVKIRLRSDVPFGTFLSGGADSGLISAIAAELSATPIKTFNVSFEDAPFDETPFAKEMARIIGSRHHVITVSREEVMKNFKSGLNLVGEPFADSSIFPTLALSKFTSEYVKMALSGDGGDELFMGYGAYIWADRLSNSWIQATRKAIAMALRFKGGNRNRRAANVFDYGRNDSIQTHIFSQEQNLFSAKEVQSLTGKFPTPYLPGSNHGRELTSSEEQAFFDLTHSLKDDLLVKIDRASMRHGLEVRVPFLDHRLIEFSLNIDPNLKRKRGEQKYILKKLLEKYYPDRLIYRQKWGFSIPMEKWLRDSSILCQTKFSDGKFQHSFDTLSSRYKTNSSSLYLYNRLYVLKCLASYV